VTTPPHANGSKNSTHSSAPTKKKKLGMICEKAAFSGAESTKKIHKKRAEQQNNSQKKSNNKFNKQTTKNCGAELAS
jgi:hypothetical protein